MCARHEPAHASGRARPAAAAPAPAGLARGAASVRRGACSRAAAGAPVASIYIARARKLPCSAHAQLAVQEDRRHAQDALPCTLLEIDYKNVALASAESQYEGSPPLSLLAAFDILSVVTVCLSWDTCLLSLVFLPALCLKRGHLPARCLTRGYLGSSLLRLGLRAWSCGPGERLACGMLREVWQGEVLRRLADGQYKFQTTHALQPNQTRKFAGSGQRTHDRICV